MIWWTTYKIMDYKCMVTNFLIYEYFNLMWGDHLITRCVKQHQAQVGI
jgi:hypothetical protein